MGELRGSACKARQLETRIEAIEAATADDTDSVTSRMGSFQDMLEAMQCKVMAHITEHAAKRDAEARQNRAELESVAERQRATDNQLADLIERSKKLAASMEKEVARLSAAAAATSVALFGVAEPPRQQRGTAVTTQLAEVVADLRDKCNGAALEETKQLAAQVRMG